VSGSRDSPIADTRRIPIGRRPQGIRISPGFTFR
jgi:hypothetical protein